MTAMSLIVQPHAAYLLTDTAFYLADGTVMQFGPKVTELHFCPIVGGPPARAAFALTGIVSPDHVKAALMKLGVKSIADVLTILPDVVRALTAAPKDRGPGVGDDDSMLLGLAIWDEATGKPYGLLIGNETCYPVERGHMEPYKLVRMRNYVQQQGTFEFQGVDYSDPAQFDPEADGGRLFDSLRLDPFGENGAEFCGVGGQGILTTVNAAGVGYKLLRTWPDKVGQRIWA